MSYVYHYSVSEYFPNGVRLDYLQLLIIEDNNIGVLCTSIQVSGDDMSIHFVASLSAPQETALDTLILAYTNPPAAPISIATDAPGPGAIILAATGESSSIRITAGMLGLTLTTTGPVVTAGNQNNARSQYGLWRKHPEVVLPDADYTLQPSDLGCGTLIINATAERTMYMPAAADWVAALIAPAIGDSLDALIINLSPTYTFVVGAATGMTMVGSSIGLASRPKNMRIVLTNVSPGTEAYTTYILS